MKLRPITKGAALSIAALLLASFDSPPEVAPPLSGAERLVVEDLREAREMRYDLGEVPGELKERLVQHAGGDIEALEFLLGILQERRIPALGDEPVQVLSIVQEKLLCEAFAEGAPKAAVRARDGFYEQLVEAAELSEPPSEVPRSGLEAVQIATGAMGRAEDVGFLLELAPESPLVGGVFESSLVELLRHDAAAYSELASRWHTLSEELLAACLRAVASAKDRAGLAFLDEVMHWEADSRASIATCVQQLGRAYNDDVNSSLGWYLEDLLTNELSSVRCTAAQALASLRHEPAIPALISALERIEDVTDARGDRERQSLQFALRAITGLSFPPRPKLWRLWLQDEERWILDDAPEVFVLLEDPDPAVVIGALNALGHRRYSRDEIATRCRPLLKHEDLDVAKRTCGVLIELDSLKAVGSLYWVLEEGPDELAHEAWLALRAITGLDLPLDAKLWRDAIPIQVVQEG